MVKTRKHHCAFLVLAVFLLLTVSTFLPITLAQGVTYSVSQEWARIEINQDRSINILYNVSFAYLSGSPQGIFTVGMPKAGYQIQYVEDSAGNSLEHQASSYTTHGIDVYLKKPITLNQPYRFVVYANVPEMVFLDTTNPGNVGMQFYPTTFSDSIGTEDLRVEIVLPAGVQTGEVKSPTSLPFDNVFVDENRTAVYWERPAWSAGETFGSGVSFPEQYVSPAPTQTPTPNGGGINDLIPIIFGAGAFLAVAAIIVTVFIGISKVAYVKPSIAVEALGANRSLTAVEAGLVMGQKPVRVLTMILYGLLLKRIVTITQAEPLLKLQKRPRQEGESAPSPRYYEIDYLAAIKPDGTLDEKALALAYQGLVSTVNQKLRGYSRDDTMNYYKSIVDLAWKRVTQAGTPELKGDALNKDLDWLLADEKFDDRFTTIFPSGTVISPNPAWWWYWGLPSGQSPSKPTPQASTTVPSSTPAKPGPLPGQDFANSVVRGLQSASNNMVKNIQDFANQLVPFHAPPSDRSVSNKKSCVCACHSCACACACVSCACACAGGGAH